MVIIKHLIFENVTIYVTFVTIYVTNGIFSIVFVTEYCNKRNPII